MGYILRSLIGFALLGLAFSLSSASCPETPGGLLFDLTGPVCSTTNQPTPCLCSEGMIGDVVSDAEYYEVQRTQLPSGPTVIVGNTKWKNEPSFIDQNGDTEPAYTAPPVWYFAWDCLNGGCFFPQDGISYSYTVRACKADPAGGSPLCSPWATSVTYPAVPYYCYNNGARVPCF